MIAVWMALLIYVLALVLVLYGVSSARLRLHVVVMGIQI